MMIIRLLLIDISLIYRLFRIHEKADVKFIDAAHEAGH